ncbi:MAG: hypothetical protein IPK76_15665 [Lewinellaceae bacterium]|nr:hypothetical protein [Lewinellaceae bacterium]
MIIGNTFFKRDAVLHARVPEEIKKAFQALAKTKGKTASEYVLGLVLKAAPGGGRPRSGRREQHQTQARMKNDIILQAISLRQPEQTIQNMVRTEHKDLMDELQRAFGEDDLVSTGTACRILGVCSKVLKILADEGHFTVYHHLKDRRYVRGELLDYRNGFRVNKKRG